MFLILRHTDDMIAKLESSGLGYNVKAKDATEKLGKPPSLPLQWTHDTVSVIATITTTTFFTFKPESAMFLYIIKRRV